eukprot:15447752-Alexandrium_andersonii.AAC.1
MQPLQWRVSLCIRFAAALARLAMCCWGPLPTTPSQTHGSTLRGGGVQSLFQNCLGRKRCRSCRTAG